MSLYPSSIHKNSKRIARFDPIISTRLIDHSIIFLNRDIISNSNTYKKLIMYTSLSILSNTLF